MAPDPNALLNQFIEPGDEVSLILPPDIQASTRVRQLAHNRMAVTLPPDLDPNVHFPLERAIKLSFFPDMPPIHDVIVTNVQMLTEPLLWMKLPDDTKDYFYRRREHVRVSIRFPVRVTCHNAEGILVEVPGECINISGGGMRFLCSESISDGGEFKLTFAPPPGVETFELPSAVVSCKPSPYRTSATSFKYVIAARFLQILPGQKDRLVGMCFRYELQQKKHLR